MTKEDFEQGFCAPHNPDIKSEINTLRPFVYHNRPALFIEGEFKSEYGAHIGNFQQRFEIDPAGKLNCDFGLLEIHPGYQKSGIGSDYIHQMEKFCKQLGVESISLVADISVGGLVWALQGYDFDGKKDRESVRDFFGKTIADEHKEGRLDENQFADAARRLSRLTHSWEFATYQTATDAKFGRKLMLNIGKMGGWEGRKDMDTNSLGYKIGAAYQRLKARQRR